ncbi:MAG: hypothetical protein KGL32_03710, partial [candidate division NC10 bacterium]|nr:hypothetical protein [candidate division NC10 bacterium]
MTSSAAGVLLRSSEADSSSALHALETSEHGLTEREVANRLEQYGKNEVTRERPPAWHWMLLRNFKNPFIV